MNSSNKSQNKANSIWPATWWALAVILGICFSWPWIPCVIGAAMALLPDSPRPFRHTQHEFLRDGRCVDLIFKGHDARDGSFLVQTSKHMGLLSVTLKSRSIQLAAEPDLRILPSGNAVIFVKNETGKGTRPIGLDQFLEGVEKAPVYK